MSTAPGYVDFADRVGTEFALHLAEGDHVPLVLSECVEGFGTFSLTFKAGPRAPIEQATFQLSADGFGPEPIFLVPIAQRPNDPQFPLEYQAIFNTAQPPVRRPDPTGFTHRLEEEAR
jgi:hypothetical protein